MDWPALHVAARQRLITGPARSPQGNLPLTALIVEHSVDLGPLSGSRRRANDSSATGKRSITSDRRRCRAELPIAISFRSPDEDAAVGALAGVAEGNEEGSCPQHAPQPCA
jgi:hypothetical protein